MKILVVSSYPPRPCGVGAYTRDQVARLRTEGHEVTVLSPLDGEGEERAAFIGGLAFRRAARLAPGFDRIVVHFQPSLYYAPRRPFSKMITSVSLWWLVGRGPNVELLVHEADPPELWRPDYFILRLAFKRAGRVWFHTEAERAALERDYRVRVRAGVMPHVVAPVSRVRPSKEEARRRLGIDGEGSILVCAGFLQRSKGFDRALEAFAAARRGGGRLFLVGSVREPTTETLDYARGLADRSRELPGVAMIERFVSDEEFDLWVIAADELLLPYRRSWSSGVLARAHALGTPSIVTRVGGLGEQVGPTDVVVDDEVGLIRAVEQALNISASFAPEAVASSSSPVVMPPEGERRRSDWDPELEAPGARKEGRKVLIGLILVSVLLAALAQITLKHGMNQVTSDGTLPLSLGSPLHTFRRVALNLAVVAGLATFVASAAVWLIVLSRVSLSFAYPFASLTYVLILLFDRFVMHERVSGIRYAGVALIVSGILLVSRTHQPS